MIVWDITERARPIEVGGPLPAGGPVSAVGFAPDGTLAAVVDGTEADAVEFLALLSSVEEVRAHPVDIACAVVEDALSPAEWAVYVSELGYRPTCSAEKPATGLTARGGRWASSSARSRPTGCGAVRGLAILGRPSASLRECCESGQSGRPECALSAWSAAARDRPRQDTSPSACRIPEQIERSMARVQPGSG